MLSIALPLAADPRLLLLDEPSRHLAPAMIDVVFGAIHHIHRERRIPALLARGLALADRVVVMARGCVAAIMSVDAVRPRDLHAYFLEGGVDANNTRTNFR